MKSLLTLLFLDSYQLTLICIKQVPGDPSTISLVTSLIPEMSESPDFLYSPIFIPENTYHYFTWRKLWILFQFSLGPRGPIIGKKITISCEFVSLQLKWWYHKFSTTPFHAVSLQKYFMHMRVEIRVLYDYATICLIILKFILCAWFYILYLILHLQEGYISYCSIFSVLI